MMLIGQLKLKNKYSLDLYVKTIFLMFLTFFCSVQSLMAQNEGIQIYEEKSTFNLDTFVSNWKQNFKESSYDKNEISKQRAVQLLNLGILYVENEDYNEAIDCLQKASDLFIRINDNDNYYYTQNWLCHVYRGTGNVDKYGKTKDEIKEAINKGIIKNPTIELFIISQYGQILKEEGDIENAIITAENSVNKAIEFFGASNPKVFSYLYTLCSLYLDKGNLSKSKDLIDIMKSLNFDKDVDKNDYYSAVLLESYWLQCSGKIGDMIRLLEKHANEIEAEKDFVKMKSHMYAALGTAYASLGNFQKAMYYDEKTLEIDRIFYGEDSPHYATALVNLSEMYALNGLDNKSTELTLKALNIFEKLFGKNNAKYIKCLQKLAGQYASSNPSKSKELYTECSHLWDNLYGKHSREYAECLIFSNLDFSFNPAINSIANVKTGLDILKSLGLDNEEFYQGYLSFYCTMLYVSKDYINLYTVASELLDNTRNYIYYNFLIIPENQRETLWNAVKQNVNGIEQYAAEYSNFAVANNDYTLINEFSRLAYDARLLKKGLLLTSSRNIENVIAKLNNPNINELIAEISNNRNKLLGTSSDSDDYDTTERSINNLERELLSLISENGDFMEFCNIKWQDIQDALMPGEVAIEFFSYPCQDDVQYGMSFVGSEGEPLTFSLFMESELNKFLIDDITTYDYQDPGLYKTIWSVLDVFSEIKDAHTIYFSADGKLNIIAVETLCDSTGLLVSDKRNIIRLSSTREILNRFSHSSDLSHVEGKADVVLYGGLDYNADLTKPVLTTFNSNQPISNPSAVQVAKRAFSNRAAYLYGTLKEVEQLSQQMRNSNVRLFTGQEGTEQSVNEMAASNPNLLHIATHGFYFDPSHNNSSTNETCQISSESRAMRESGLLFSGANHKLLGEYIDNEDNDGILTAEEISNISLLSTDLVVLSACETGLGSISDEGIFGLQRGFKLSGVNSIIMALWKVDDEATKELMNCFYKSLLSGSSKVESLRDAQEKIRRTPGFEDPEYWAGFILLDALN